MWFMWTTLSKLVWAFAVVAYQAVSHGMNQQPKSMF